MTEAQNKVEITFEDFKTIIDKIPKNIDDSRDEDEYSLISIFSTAIQDLSTF